MTYGNTGLLSRTVTSDGAATNYRYNTDGKVTRIEDEGLGRVDKVAHQQSYRVRNVELAASYNGAVSTPSRVVGTKKDASGRTIETYKDALVINEANLEVNVLRLGRIGLYYQTNDAAATGRWDADTKQWVALTDGKARNQVRRGLRIARKLVAPDLLLLEVAAPEVAR